MVQDLPEPFRSGVIDAYADSLAPAFWYLVPLVVVGLVLALFLREVRLSDVAGMVARGEAVAAPAAAARAAHGDQAPESIEGDEDSERADIVVR